MANLRLFHHVSVQEAKENKEYWNIMEYQYTRAAKLLINGYAKNCIYVKSLVKKQPDLDSKQQERLFHRLTKYLAAVWITSNEQEFARFSVDRVKQSLTRFSEYWVKERLIRSEIQYDESKLSNLRQDMDNLRKIWQKKVEGEGMRVKIVEEDLVEIKREFKINDVMEAQVIAPIKEGRWHDLNYDRDFKRLLYRALRLKKITPEELLFAEIVSSTKAQQPNQICKTYDYKEEGPYDVKNYVSYMTDDHSVQFKSELPLLPKNQQVYVTIDLCRKYEIGFLYLYITAKTTWGKGTGGIDDPRLHHKKHFYNAMEQYLNRLALRKTCTEEELKEARSDLLKMKTVPNFWPYHDKLTAFILKNEPDLNDFLLDKTNDPIEQFILDDALHLVMDMETDEEIPVLGVKTIDPNNPEHIDRPILFRILPSTGSFALLEHVLFGESEVVRAKLTAGQFTTRYMKYIEKLSQGRARAVEVNPCGVKQSERIHTVAGSLSAVITHDFYVHLFRCSSMPLKLFSLRLLLMMEKERLIEMDKLMWANVDKPDKWPTVNCLKKDPVAFKELILFLINRVLLTNDEFYGHFHSDSNSMGKSSTAMLAHFEMHLNQSEWNELLRPADLTVGDIVIDEKYMTNIINTFPHKNTQFYVLVYHVLYPYRKRSGNSLFEINFVDELDGKVTDYIQEITKYINPVDLITWKQNEEMSFKPSLSLGSDSSITIKNLAFSFNRHLQNKLSVEHKDPIEESKVIDIIIQTAIACLKIKPVYHDRYLSNSLKAFNEQTLKLIYKKIEERIPHSDPVIVSSLKIILAEINEIRVNPPSGPERGFIRPPSPISL